MWREGNSYTVKSKLIWKRKEAWRDDGETSDILCYKDRKEKRKGDGLQENQASCSSLDPNKGNL